MNWIDGEEVTPEEFERRTANPKGQSGYFIDGEKLPKQAFFARIAKRSKKFAPSYVQGSFKKPIACETSAIHPSQIEKFKEFDKKHHCSVEYKPDGRPIFRDREQRRKYLRAHKLVDRSSFTGY